MKRMPLGRSGLLVSPICLGGMSFGDPSRGEHGWVLPPKDGLALIHRAVELGITFLDTAGVYAEGSSEALVGEALRSLGRRTDIVVSTKVSPSRDPADPFLLDRSRIVASVQRSLERLRLERIDLLQLHRLDPATRLEETLEGLQAVVEAGLVAEVGASSMYAWQFMKALALQDRYGYRRFVTMHDQLNLIYREEEREMIPLCLDQGVALVPYSPLARGLLVAPRRETSRAALDVKAAALYAPSQAMLPAIRERLSACAAARGVSTAMVALAWVLERRPVASVTVGATCPRHLEDAVAAAGLSLDAEEIAALEEPYRPREHMN